MCTVQPLGEIKIGGRNPCEHLFFLFSERKSAFRIRKSGNSEDVFSNAYDTFPYFPGRL